MPKLRPDLISEQRSGETGAARIVNAINNSV